jgi:hypothetical protein
MIRGSVIHRKTKGQVKVTVVKGSIPAYADLVAAHQPRNGLGVEEFPEEFQIILFLVSSEQVLSESPQGHVGDREQSSKGDAESTIQLAPIFFLQSCLRGGQERTSGIVHQV